MKTILVTGGNRGIGLEICHQLDVLGHQVILCSRDYERGLLAASQLSSNLIVKQLDVTDEQSIQSLFKYVGDEIGKLDVLINNAGINGSEKRESKLSKVKDKIQKDYRGLWKMAKAVKPVLEKAGITGKREGASDVPMDKARLVMETNFYGPWRMIQVFQPLLAKSDDARIINISSGMGELASLTGEWPAYSLSKSSLNALTIMFANELKKKGIRVNAMCPGWVKTDMGGPDAPRSVSQGADTAVWLATGENIPTGKFFRDRKEINW